MNISAGGGIESQTTTVAVALVTKDWQYIAACGSAIYCACNSIMHEETQKIWSD